MNQKLIIVMIGVIAIAVTLYISVEIWSTQEQERIDTRTAFIENCRQWGQDIEQERIRLENNLFANYDSLNQWISEYNRECAG